MKENRRHKFPYLHRGISRHGKETWYFWHRPGKKIRVRGEYGTPEFEAAYWEASYGQIACNVPVLPNKAARVSPEIERSLKALQRSKVSFKNRKLPPTHEQTVSRAVAKAVIRAQKRAREKGETYEVSYEWAMKRVMSNGYKCEATGVSFLDSTGDGHGMHPFGPTIDRIDSTLGYTLSNCRIVCCAFNIGVSAWGDEIYRYVAAAYLEKGKRAA